MTDEPVTLEIQDGSLGVVITPQEPEPADPVVEAADLT